MVTVSLCMIVKNEEAVLARCLQSAHGIADEIVIVDTGSSDRTKEIAARFTDKVYDFVWVDDFSAARNYSFAQATKDYVMWLDADDVILPDDREKLLRLKETLPQNTDIVTVKYNVGFDENGIPTLTSTRGRLFRRERGFKWQDEIHEYIPLSGVMHAADDIFITHMPPEKEQESERNLRIYRKILKRDGRLDPRGKYYYARELKDHGKFKEAARWFRLFLMEGKGWVEDTIAACFNGAICYRVLGSPEQMRAVLLESFRFDAPRPEICSMLGYYYKDTGDFRTAAAWFETALGLPERGGMGFVLADYRAFIPAIEAAVCYDRLGELEKAEQMNELAGKAKPDAKEYLYNKAYFEKAASAAVE